MFNEDLLELTRGFAAARRVASAANVLYKLKLNPHRIAYKSNSGIAVEILLKLVKAGGKAALSSLIVGDAHQTIAVLREMERNRIVKILETPFRTYIVLTAYGWKTFNELVDVLL